MKQQTLAMAADQTFEQYRKPTARVEHAFGVVKRLWGFGKVRYRGLQKNATRAFTSLAPANIYLGRQRLLAQSHFWAWFSA